MLMTLFASNMLAQEKVRGIETRLVKTGERYRDKVDLYAIEFTNRNSIPVSVTMELWKQGTYSSYYERYSEDKIQSSKDIVLKPNETYRWETGLTKSDESRLRTPSMVDAYPSYYYYKYEAYKLQ